MSKDNVKRFFEELENNVVLREKFISSMADEMSQSAIISFAASNGFSFSDEELQEYCTELSDNMNSNQEVDDESLAKVSGGLFKTTAIVASICGLGLVCAALSVYAAATKSDCGIALSVSGGRECHD